MKRDFSRQSFLGPNSQQAIECCRVAISGLGGGGSHIAQQLAHLGFLDYTLFDPDTIESSNLNRLVGGTQRDVDSGVAKVDIARRVITGVRPNAKVTCVKAPWQQAAPTLRRCDLVFGCVDGFDQRRQLEATARRNLIPLIDIGMDVFAASDGSFAMAGQVILSMPGCACMSCMGFLNEKTLAREAAAYGAAGAQPQVVWANGVLASTAVGIAVDLLTNWSTAIRHHVYLSYRGGAGTVAPHARLPFVPKVCSHYPLRQSGSARFERL
jgi:molybdopterin-synthase adenylyltransferase